MQTVNLNVAQTDYSRGEPRAWEKEIILTASGESEWIIIPEQADVVCVTINFFNGASGKMQTTTDLVYEIKRGNAIPCDWPYGEINSQFQTGCRPCNGIRAVQIKSGIMKVTLNAR